MNFRQSIRYAACFFAGMTSVGAAGAYPFLSAKGEFSTFFNDLKYDPDKGCTKPDRPYGNDRYEWEAYRSDGARYLACIKDAATNDMEYATTVVGDGYKKAARDFIQEVEGGY